MNGTVQLLHHRKPDKPQNTFVAVNTFQNSTSCKLSILWYTVRSIDPKLLLKITVKAQALYGSFPTQLNWFFCQLTSLFKDKLDHICVLYCSTIVSISLFCCYLMWIYVPVCITPFKIPIIRTKYLIDFKDLNQVCPLYLFMYFFTIVPKKKKYIFALIPFHFLETITETFLMQLNGTKINKKKHLTLTFTKNEFPITQQGLLLFRAESLQFTSFPA